MSLFTNHVANLALLWIGVHGNMHLHTELHISYGRKIMPLEIPINFSSNTLTNLCSSR